MTTEELKDLRTRVLEAINRELQPTRMTDEELLKAITSLVDRESRGDYLLPIQKMDTVNSIYKMYRGLGGLLDSILADEDITEVMINGPDNIFVERKGRLTRVDKHFKDEQELRRVIDLIVGKAHREVSEANPIVDFKSKSTVFLCLSASKFIAILQILCKIKVEVHMDLVSAINVYPADKLADDHLFCFKAGTIVQVCMSSLLLSQ